MPSLIYPQVSFSRGTFSVFIAPSHFLFEALNNYLVRERGNILSLSGNIPVILPRIRTNKRQWQIHTVTEADQILTILKESHEHLILLEHDRSLYDADADLIESIGHMCRRKVSERATIFMFASRRDEWIIKFEPFAHKFVILEEIVYNNPVLKADFRGVSAQRTLEGVFLSLPMENSLK